MNDIEPGTYQVIITAADSAVTRTGVDTRHITVVTLDSEPPVVLYGYLVDAPEARWVWEETGAGDPDDIKVGMMFMAEVIRDRTRDNKPVLRIGKLKADPDVPLQFTEQPEEPARRIRRESFSRKSAIQREFERISETIDTYLFETADPGPVTEPRPYANAKMGQVGVVFPDSGIEGGAVLESGFACRLGAQLLRAGRMVEEFIELSAARRDQLTEVEREAHRRADSLAQRVLGDIEPEPGESPGSYGSRMDRTRRAFREAHPEWQPERFNR